MPQPAAATCLSLSFSFSLLTGLGQHTSAMTSTTLGQSPGQLPMPWERPSPHCPLGAAQEAGLGSVVLTLGWGCPEVCPSNPRASSPSRALGDRQRCRTLAVGTDVQVLSRPDAQLGLPSRSRGAGQTLGRVTWGVGASSPGAGGAGRQWRWGHRPPHPSSSSLAHPVQAGLPAALKQRSIYS